MRTVHICLTSPYIYDLSKQCEPAQQPLHKKTGQFSTASAVSSLPFMKKRFSQTMEIHESTIFDLINIHSNEFNIP